MDAKDLIYVSREAYNVKRKAFLKEHDTKELANRGYKFDFEEFTLVQNTNPRALLSQVWWSDNEASSDCAELQTMSGVITLRAKL